MLGIARSLSARKEWSEQRFQSIKTGTTNGLEECDHFHLLGENSRLPGGRQASELLAVPVGRSPPENQHGEQNGVVGDHHVCYQPAALIADGHVQIRPSRQCFLPLTSARKARS